MKMSQQGTTGKQVNSSAAKFTGTGAGQNKLMCFVFLDQAMDSVK